MSESRKLNKLLSERDRVIDKIDLLQKQLLSIVGNELGKEYGVDCTLVCGANIGELGLIIDDWAGDKRYRLNINAVDIHKKKGNFHLMLNWLQILQLEYDSESPYPNFSSTKDYCNSQIPVDLFNKISNGKRISENEREREKIKYIFKFESCNLSDHILKVVNSRKCKSIVIELYDLETALKEAQRSIQQAIREYVYELVPQNKNVRLSGGSHKYKHIHHWITAKYQLDGINPRCVYIFTYNHYLDPETLYPIFDLRQGSVYVGITTGMDIFKNFDDVTCDFSSVVKSVKQRKRTFNFDDLQQIKGIVEELSIAMP